MVDYPKAKKLIGKAGWCFAAIFVSQLSLFLLEQPGIMKSIGEHPFAAMYYVRTGFCFAFIYYMVYAAKATGRNKFLWAFLASVISLIALLILYDRIREESFRKEEELLETLSGGKDLVDEAETDKTDYYRSV